MIYRLITSELSFCISVSQLFCLLTPLTLIVVGINGLHVNKALIIKEAQNTARPFLLTPSLATVSIIIGINSHILNSKKQLIFKIVTNDIWITSKFSIDQQLKYEKQFFYLKQKGSDWCVCLSGVRLVGFSFTSLLACWLVVWLGGQVGVHLIHMIQIKQYQPDELTVNKLSVLFCSLMVGFYDLSGLAVGIIS